MAIGMGGVAVAENAVNVFQDFSRCQSVALTVQAWSTFLSSKQTNPSSLLRYSVGHSAHDLSPLATQELFCLYESYSDSMLRFTGEHGSIVDCNQSQELLGEEGIFYKTGFNRHQSQQCLKLSK